MVLREDVFFLALVVLGFPRPLNFGLHWLSAHKAWEKAMELSQSSTKLTFPVAGLQHMPQCQVICCPLNHFLPLKQSSWNLSKYLNLEKSQLKNFAGTGDWTRVCSSQSWLWCIYCWIALMQTWNQRLVALEGGKGLFQHGPLGVAYHHRHPISTIPVARITAHATVPVNLKAILYLDLIWCQFPKLLKLRWT